MTRQSARIKWQVEKAGAEKEEMGKSLLSLTPELVVMVASYLDVSSYLAFASSSSALIGILVSERQWKTLLQKTRMNAKRLITQFEYPGGYIDYLDLLNTEKKDMEMEVKELANFLKSVNDPGGKLLLALLDIICERFPGDFEPKFEAVVSLSCPCHTFEAHHVTLFGFNLLDQAEIIIGGAHSQPQQKLLALRTFCERIEYLEEFASRASRQKPKVAKLETNMDCDYININYQSKEVWLKLLQNCKQWDIGRLVELDWTISGGNIVALFEGMAKESARGTIGIIMIYDKVITESKGAQLKRLWRITRDKWHVRCLQCRRDIKMIRGDWQWSRTLAVIKSIQSKKLAHYKICVPK